MPVLQQCTQLHNLIEKDSWILFKLLQSNTGASFFTTNPKLWSPNSNYTWKLKPESKQFQLSMMHLKEH